MTYLDYGIIAILVLGLLFGFIGKAPKKIFKFIFMAIAFVFTLIASSTFTPKIVNSLVSEIPFLKSEYTGTVREFLIDKVKSVDMMNTLYQNNQEFRSLINATPDRLVQIILLLVIGILSLILIPMVGNIISGIFTRKAQKGTAKKTLGLFSLVKTALFLAIVLYPIFLLSPILSKGNELYTLFTGDNANPKVSNVLTIVSDNISDSKFVNLFDKTIEKKQIKFLKYVDENEKECYYYTDLKDVSNMVATVSIFSNMSSLNDITGDQVREIILSVGNSDLAKGLISDALDEFGIEGINVDDINFEEEADTIAKIVDLANSESSENIDIDELASSLSNSELVKAVAENNEGLLHGQVDEQDVEAIDDALNGKVASGELSQEDYETLMKLFNEKPATEQAE